MTASRFPKRLRLLNAAQFDAAFKRGKRINAGSFAAVVAANELGFARLGFAIAKKQAASSVLRNRIRRLLREQFRIEQHALAPVDLVLMLRSKLPDDPAKITEATKQFWTLLASRCARS